MNKRALLIAVIFFTLFFSCQKNEIEDKKQWWKSLDTIAAEMLDTTYFQRKTAIKGNLENYQTFIALLNDYKKKNAGFSKEKFNSFADSLSESLGLKYSKVTEILDQDYINKNKIYFSNKLAYKAFIESNWKDSVSYKDFQEYILPYKLTNEIFDNWRDTLYGFHQNLVSQSSKYKNLDSLYSYHLKTTGSLLEFNGEKPDYYPLVENFTWYNIVKQGDCASRNRNVIYYLRAAGVPATFDYLVGWGNRSYSRHSVVGLSFKNKLVKNLIKNRNEPANLKNDLNAAMSVEEIHFFSKKDLPKNLDVQYEKTIPKIYRETWTVQPFIYDVLAKVPRAEIYTDLIKPNMIDVSSKYLEVADVEIRKDFFEKKSIAYLGVFDLSGWRPVSYSIFNWLGKAVFKDMGKNILYLPLFFENELTAFGAPFILEDSGNKRILKCNKKKLINIKLIRKYPLFSDYAIRSVDFKGSKIESSNHPNFKKAKMLYTINHFPFSIQEINFKKTEPMRYMRFKTPDGRKMKLAELEVFQDSSGVMKKLEDVEYKKNKLKYKDIFDENPWSFSDTTVVNLDFGTPKKIARIRFCPRIDMNFIFPNTEYELFYWDNSWISVGKKIAKGYSLEFKNIPSETIYLLKTLDENDKYARIFTYENGRQVWW